MGTHVFNSIIRPTTDGTDFITPSVIFGPDGKTELFTNTNPGYAVHTPITQLDYSNIPLPSGGIYQSATSLNVAPYKAIVGSVFADQSGTLLIQQSWDGTSWDVQSSISVSTNAGQGFDVDVVAPYGRLVYNNGTTAQSTFRLYAGGKMV